VTRSRAPRILHIGKYLPPVPGGIETYLGDLLRICSGRKLDVGAVVHGKTGYPDPRPDDFGGATLFTAPSLGELLYAPIAPSFLVVLRQAIREFQPDVLHFHVPNTSAFWALLLPEARRIPWVLHWHADVDVCAMPFTMGAAYTLYRFFEKMMLERASAIIATSRPYLEASRALRSYQRKCIVLPLGLDPARLFDATPAEIAKAKAHWPTPASRKVLSVGRLTYYKGFDTLVHALLRAPDCSLLIAGEGALREHLEQHVRELRLTDRVRFLGRVSDRDLAAYYSACDVFCLSSIDRSEAFGLVLLEAAHYGASILASDIPGSGVPWVARTLGAELIPANDADALAAALLRPPRGSGKGELVGSMELEPERLIALYSAIDKPAVIK
jgi:glycosyltransferase involved in cell wall biosynthesis